jgi:hypothetical protein
MFASPFGTAGSHELRRSCLKKVTCKQVRKEELLGKVLGILEWVEKYFGRKGQLMGLSRQPVYRKQADGQVVFITEAEILERFLWTGFGQAESRL